MGGPKHAIILRSGFAKEEQKNIPMMPYGVHMRLD